MRPDSDSAGQPLRLMPRRQLIKGAAATAGGFGATLAALRGGNASGVHVPDFLASLVQGVEATPDAFSPSALTADEIETLRAIQNRLIPGDEFGPGAGDSGAFIYVDRTLAGPGAAALPLYQAGLAAIAAAAGASGFAALSAADQDGLLTSLEAGEIADAPPGFFFTMIQQTRQGMFCDPMYGGNIGFAGWDLIGYPGHKFVYSEEDQAIGTIVEPAHASIAEFGGVPYEDPA